jgi:hypothetical protein
MSNKHNSSLSHHTISTIPLELTWQANQHLLQRSKLQQTAPNSSTFIYPAIYNWEFTVTSVTSVTLALSPLYKPAHKCYTTAISQQTVTNCNIECLINVIYDKKSPPPTATTATLQHCPLNQPEKPPYKCCSAATNCNILPQTATFTALSRRLCDNLVSQVCVKVFPSQQKKNGASGPD